jgi:PAS domain S-box-containing protein
MAQQAHPSPDEASFQLLFEHNPQPMWVYDAASLRFLAVNHAAVATYGYSHDEFLHMTIADIRPPEDVPALLANLSEPRPALQHSGEWRHRCKDGRLIDVEVTSHTITFAGRPAVLVVAHDITARKRLEAALRESEARYRRIVDTAEEGVCETDGQWRISYVNARFATMVGYPATELVGRPAEWVLAEPDRPLFAEQRRQREQGTRGVYEIRFRRADGTPFWVLVAAAPFLDEAGRFAGSVAMVTDIDARKRQEEVNAFLARVGPVLASSLDYEATLTRVAELAVPTLADWCAVHIIDPGGTPRPLAIAHVDPTKAAWAWDLQQRYPVDLTAAHGLANVLRTGRPELYAEIPDALLVASARDAAHLALMRRVGLRAAMIVPLLARDRVLGAIVLAMAESGRRYTEHDLVLAEELARRAALFVANAHLYHETQAALAKERATRAELQRSRQLIIQATETLRREIAEILHGRVQSHLLVAWHRLGQAAQFLDHDLDAARALIAQVREEIDQIREREVREASHALHPSIINVGLVPAVRSLCGRFADHFTVTLAVDPALEARDASLDEPLPALLRLAAYRVIEEALTNAYRHGAASQVQILLQLSEDERLQLTVRDNGRGCDPAQIQAGIGLSSIAGHVDLFGGTWALESTVGGGTTLTAVLPLPRAGDGPRLAV